VIIATTMLAVRRLRLVFAGDGDNAGAIQSAGTVSVLRPSLASAAALRFSGVATVWSSS
jgi:hypothetical protein